MTKQLSPLEKAEYVNWNGHIIKKLSPLQAFAKHKNNFRYILTKSFTQRNGNNKKVLDEVYDSEFYVLNIIETALNRLEMIDRLNEKYCDDIQKSLKALEIIKEKGLNVDYFQRVCDEEYEESIFCIEKLLTEEQFDLLKEVLK